MDRFGQTERPEEISDKIAKKGLHTTNALPGEKAIRELVIGVAWTALLVPFIFLCQNLSMFGSWEIGPVGWGLTVFLIVLQVLITFLPYLERRPEFQTRVEVREWVKRVGIFWFMSCCLGPLFGWMVTWRIIEITATSWRWRYGLRTFLAAGLPVLLVLPLTGYFIRVKSRVTLPFLLIVTLLPVLSAAGVSLDLWKGPVIRQDETGKPVLYLRYTDLQFDKPDG